MVLLKELFENAKKEYKIERKNQKKINKKKINPTGFYHVHLQKCNRCKNGILWTYETNEIHISRVDFLDLKNIVIERGYEWGVEYRYYALKTSKIVGLPLYDLK